MLGKHYCIRGEKETVFSKFTENWTENYKLLLKPRKGEHFAICKYWSSDFKNEDVIKYITTQEGKGFVNTEKVK